MGMRSERWRRRRWRRSSPLLLSLLALAYACAVLVCVCALHEVPFALASDSKYASALADDALGLDDDDVDDDDPVAFTLEAAQEEAARLLGSFGEGVFLPDDEGDDDGDVEASAEAGRGVENVSVEKEDRDNAEHEMANDANVRRITIKLHRSDATVVDADGDGGTDTDRNAHSEVDAGEDGDAEDNLAADGFFGDEADDEQTEPEFADPDASDRLKFHRSGATVENSDDDAESGVDDDFGVARNDVMVVDANGDDDTESEADAEMESEAEDDSDDGFFGDETDAQTEAELEELASDPEEVAELTHSPSAAEEGGEEEPNDAELMQPVKETSDNGDAEEQEPSQISKRVSAVFLKVRGVIFPHSKADDRTNAGDAIADILLDEVAPDELPPAAIIPSSGEVVLDVHGDQNGAPSTSYKDTVTAVEQVSSFQSIEFSRDPVDLEADDSSDLADNEESNLEGDASLPSHSAATQEAIEAVSFESAEFIFGQTDNEQDDDSSDSFAVGVSGFKRDDIEVVEVEFKSEVGESSFSSSLNEGVQVEVSITGDADDAAFDEEEVEEIVAAVVVNALCEADPAPGTNTCEPQLLASPIVSSEQYSSTENDEPTATFREIVLEMATAAKQIVDALRQGHYPHMSVAFSRARAKSRAKLDACVKAVKDPVGDVIHVLHEYILVAKAETGSDLEVVFVHLNTLYEDMKQYASLWSHCVCSAYRQVSHWSWEVWSTYEEVRILGRNMFGLALLLPCGLLFSSLYRVAAAVPEFLCTYFLTFDEVTRAQLKIFSVVLLMVLVYHARVLAWFWILLSAALGYYYWSGHVVISVKFK